MYYFTSESVSPGHPDKLCDHLSDSILDHVLEQDKHSRVACETFVKGKENQPGTVVVCGEITTSGNLDIDKLIRETILEIGYNSNELGFNGNECEIIKLSILMYSPISTQVISILDPGDKIIFSWDQIKNDGYTALEGVYKISTKGIDVDGNNVEKSTTVTIWK